MHLRFGTAAFFATGLVTFSAATRTASAQSSNSDLQILRADAHVIDVRWSPGEPAVRDVRLGDAHFAGLGVERAGLRIVEGEPILPERRILIELPDDGDVKLHVSAEGEHYIPVKLAPAPGGDDVPKKAPARLKQYAEIEYIGWMREHRVASVRVAPVIADARSGALRAAGKVRLQLLLSGAGSTARAVSRPALRTPAAEMDDLYRSVVANPWTVSTGSRRGPSPAPVASAPAAAPTSPMIGRGASGGFAASAIGSPATPPTGTPDQDTEPFGSPRTLSFRVEVSSEGIYQITYNDLASLGVPMQWIQAKKLRMRRENTPIAIVVEGEADGTFDPGDRILFFGRPKMNDVYTSTEVYWLEQDLGPAPAGIRMTPTDVTPGNTVSNPVSFRDTVHSEQNSLYYQQLPNVGQSDHWFWTKNLAPATNDFTILTYDPDPAGSQINVRAKLFGYTSTPANPDHHTKVSLNLNLVSDETWDGAVGHLHNALASRSLLQQGNNSIRVEQVADTQAIVDGAYVDWVEIEYDRLFFAVNNSLTFTYASTQPTTFISRHFQSAVIYAFDITNPDQPRSLVNGVPFQLFSSAFLTFSVVPGANPPGRFITLNASAFKSPASITIPTSTFVPPPGGADLLIIVPKALRSSVDPLAQYRTSQGLRVAVCEAESIYDTYGGGLRSPNSIFTFVQNAYQTWTAPAPTSVLLVGEATYDFLGYGPTTLQQTLPTTMHPSQQEGEVPSDYKFACVSGNDPLPDLFVGRISADTPTTVANVVNKIIARETVPPGGAWKTNVLHIADKGGSFTSTLDTLAQFHVQSPYVASPVYFDNYGTNSSMNAAMTAALNGGSALSTFLGHGAITNLGQFFGATDAANLANTDKTPFQIVLNCTAGYFASPVVTQCIGEEMLVKANAGCSAFFGSVSNGFISQLTAVSTACYDRIFVGESAGSATTGGKVDAYVLYGVLEDNLWEIQLLGDPTAKVLPP